MSDYWYCCERERRKTSYLLTGKVWLRAKLSLHNERRLTGTEGPASWIVLHGSTVCDMSMLGVKATLSRKMLEEQITESKNLLPDIMHDSKRTWLLWASGHIFPHSRVLSFPCWICSNWTFQIFHHPHHHASLLLPAWRDLWLPWLHREISIYAN